MVEDWFQLLVMNSVDCHTTTTQGVVHLKGVVHLNGVHVYPKEHHLLRGVNIQPLIRLSRCSILYEF